jgi:hypothetical protein
MQHTQSATPAPGASQAITLPGMLAERTVTNSRCGRITYVRDQRGAEIRAVQFFPNPHRDRPPPIGPRWNTSHVRRDESGSEWERMVAYDQITDDFGNLVGGVVL